MLRDKIAKMFLLYGLDLLKPEETIPDDVSYADQILALIDAQRCVWTLDRERRTAKTECGKDMVLVLPYDSEHIPFCCACGHRIEVKEG